MCINPSADVTSKCAGCGRVFACAAPRPRRVLICDDLMTCVSKHNPVRHGQCASTFAVAVWPGRDAVFMYTARKFDRNQDRLERDGAFTHWHALRDRRGWGGARGRLAESAA